MSNPRPTRVRSLPFHLRADNVEIDIPRSLQSPSVSPAPTSRPDLSTNAASPAAESAAEDNTREGSATPVSPAWSPITPHVPDKQIRARSPVDAQSRKDTDKKSNRKTSDQKAAKSVRDDRGDYEEVSGDLISISRTGNQADIPGEDREQTPYSESSHRQRAETPEAGVSRRSNQARRTAARTRNNKKLTQAQRQVLKDEETDRMMRTQRAQTAHGLPAAFPSIPVGQDNVEQDVMNADGSLGLDCSCPSDDYHSVNCPRNAFPAPGQLPQDDNEETVSAFGVASLPASVDRLEHYEPNRENDLQQMRNKFGDL